MSVRRMERKSPKTGMDQSFWMIDVCFERPDGEVKRVRKVSPQQSKRGAEAYERQLRAELLADACSGEEVFAPPAFDEFTKEFLDVYVATNNKYSERLTKEMILRLHLVPFFQGEALDRIGLQQIERYKAAKLKAELSPKTINNHLTVLRKLLVTAVEWHKLKVVPQIKWLKAPEPDFDFLDFAERERLMEKSEPEWRAMILTGLHTGLRLGELLGLRWEDVDLVAKRLMVRQAFARNRLGTPKNGRTREVPLNDVVLQALKGERHLRGEYVFCQPDGKPLTKEMCKRPLWKACKRAGMRLIGWHCLRHTFASHLVQRGVPIKAVQELLGHQTIEMTMRYSHLSPDVRRDAVKLIEANGNLTATDAVQSDKGLKLLVK